MKELITCPITHEIMREPVLLSDGHSYEESAILNWLKTNSTSPVTKSPVHSKKVYKNHALRLVIEAYRQGRILDREEYLRDNNAVAAVHARPVKLDEELRAYTVKAPFSLIYASWSFTQIAFELARDDIVLANSRYQVGSDIFVSIEGHGFVNESELDPLPLCRDPFVVQLVYNMGLRSLPNTSRNAMIQKEEGEYLIARAGSMYSGSLSIQSTSGTTFYLVSDCTRKFFLFDQQTVNSEAPLLKKVPIKHRPEPDRPWVLEANQELALRLHPDHSQSLRLQVSVKKGAMVPSREMVVSADGCCRFFRVTICGVSGWLFDMYEETVTMNLLLRAPIPITKTPGECIRFYCESSDRWILLCDKEDENNEMMIGQTAFFSENAPNAVCKLINSCLEKECLIHGFAFRKKYWYVSGSNASGNSQCWGTVPDATPNSMVAIGGGVSSSDCKGKVSFAVCHQGGGFKGHNLRKAVLETMRKAESIQSLCLTSDPNEYFIKYNGRKMAWCIKNYHVDDDIAKGGGGGSICSVAKFDNESWIVFLDFTYRHYGDVPKDLLDILDCHYEIQCSIHVRQKKRILEYDKALE